MTHAFAYTGEEKYRAWVLDYLNGWEERTARNGGITPDNIGLSGEIGEYNEGQWWGGYYGWRWPHGAMTLMEPMSIGMRSGLPRSHKPAGRARKKVARNRCEERAAMAGSSSPFSLRNRLSRRNCAEVIRLMRNWPAAKSSTHFGNNRYLSSQSGKRNIRRMLGTPQRERQSVKSGARK